MSNQTMTKQKKTGIIVAAVVVVLALALLVCWAAFRPQALEGYKAITINVEHSDGTVASFELESQAETLWEAQVDEGILAGEESDYGIFVTTVDGETADDSAGQYWMYNCNGEMAEYGVESQVIEDGDVFDFYLYVYEG